MPVFSVNLPPHHPVSAFRTGGDGKPFHGVELTQQPAAQAWFFTDIIRRSAGDHPEPSCSKVSPASTLISTVKVGRLMKAAMFEKILRTGNANSNRFMLAIKIEMGVKHYIAWTVWQIATDKVFENINS